MDESTIDVEVAFAKLDEQVIIPVSLNKESTVQQAIINSAILKRFPELDLAEIKVGVFGKTCPLQKKIEQGDRIEIYRPLLQHPMEARRNRASK